MSTLISASASSSASSTITFMKPIFQRIVITLYMVPYIFLAYVMCSKRFPFQSYLPACLQTLFDAADKMHQMNASFLIFQLHIAMLPIYSILCTFTYAHLRKYFLLRRSKRFQPINSFLQLTRFGFETERGHRLFD